MLLGSRTPRIFGNATPKDTEVHRKNLKRSFLSVVSVLPFNIGAKDSHFPCVTLLKEIVFGLPGERLFPPQDGKKQGCRCEWERETEMDTRNEHTAFMPGSQGVFLGVLGEE